jgi:cell division protein FtsQ
MMKHKNIALLVLLLVVVIALLGFAETRQSARVCKDLNVKILGDEKQHFVEWKEIKQLVLNHGDSVLNQPLTSIKVSKIEKTIEDLAAVKNAEVHLTLDGILNVEVEQRKPLVRVFNNRGESGYLDEVGSFMPLSNKYTARVMVANGHYDDGLWAFDINKINANDSLKKEWVLDDIFELATYIAGNEFWKAQINQVYYNRDGEFELIPRVGSHIILLGKAEQLEEKFDKLYAFYQKGLPNTDWNAYELINLKYKNQVVCTKK